MEADALATAIMVMGKDKGLQFIEITPSRMIRILRLKSTSMLLNMIHFQNLERKH